MAYGMQTTEVLILQLDAEYFGSNGIATSSTVMFTGAYIGAIGGVAFASFLSTYTTNFFYVICSSLLYHVAIPTDVSLLSPAGGKAARRVCNV